MSTTEHARTATTDLRRHLSGGTTVVGAGEPDGAPGLWRETGRRPAVRVEVADERDVTVAVRIAADHGLHVAVWGGRRDVAGRNAGAGAVVVDVRRLRRTRHDPGAATLTVGGGTTVRDVLAALPADRVTVTPANPDVGMVGAAVGGGYGPLLPRHGLVADQLVGARLVLADGTATDADADLLWALRGGGSGFGVITEATFATHALAAVRHTVVAVPLAGAERALLTVQGLLDDEPDHLSVLPMFHTGPDGETALAVVAHWTGGADRGEEVADVLQRLPGAATVVAQQVPYAQSLNPDEDALFPPGRRYSVGTSTISRLDADAARHLVESARAVPSHRSLLFLHDFHGAPTRVPSDATAFPLRRDHFVVAAATPSDPGDDGAARRHQEWADATVAVLSAAALPGGYVNFLDPAATDRVTAFYGAAAPRLLALADRVDPGHVFCGATGIGSVRRASRDEKVTG